FGFVTRAAFIITVPYISIFDGVAEWKGANIVEERCDSKAFVKHSLCMSGLWIKKDLVGNRKHQGSDHLIHAMHDSNHMGESIVLCARKNVICESQLFDPAETLEERGVDDLFFP